MNRILIKLFGFFLGLLIISIIISFIKVKESFIDSNNIITIDKIGDYKDDDDMKHRILKMKNFDIAKFKLNDKDDSDDSDDDKDDNDEYDKNLLRIPYKGYKFICINTYKDINKVSLTDGKWYDIDYDSDDEDDKKSKNYKYFKFEKTVILKKNLLNNKIGAMGVDITNIQLNGPDCYYFANNDKNYELSEFSMYMTVYINNCKKNSNNIIFEMTGNTELLNDNYITNIININLIKNSYDNYDIHITIGSILYDKIANNIDKNIIEKNNNLLIGLLYTNDNITLIINNSSYSDTNKNRFKITLGSKPLIINKDGNISMYLYNFVYYKSIYKNVNSLIRYNIYYLSGLHNKSCYIDNTSNITPEQNNIKLNKFKIPKINFNYSDEYEEPNFKSKNDNDNKKCTFKLPEIDIDEIDDNIKQIKSDIDDKIIKPNIDRIKSDIETNIKDKTDLLKNTLIQEEENQEEEPPSFFKRLFNFF